MKVFDDLVGRGLIKQATDAGKIRQLLEGEAPCSFYLGIDATADSLHIGHLIPLITAMRLKKTGHICYILLGDATATIGDPSGKSTARPVLSKETIDSNVVALKDQVKKIVADDTQWFAKNSVWFNHMKFMEMMQDVGVHFSVNNMLRAECFKSRLEQGLTFLEFSYMLMQAFDFFWFHDCLGVNLQIGGDDQWSNMLAGTDLIHKKLGHDSFAFTTPLLVNSDGTKMGKTEKGTVWLDEKKTSVFDFFQFWRNIPDNKVVECLLFFTSLTPEDAKDSFVGINQAKKTLAFEITKIVHGEAAAQQALEQAEALFESRDTSLVESVEIKEGDQILDVLVRCQLAKSRTDGRHLIAGQGITINSEVLTDPTLILTRSQFGSNLVLRKGKKHFRPLHFTKDTNEST